MRRLLERIDTFLSAYYLAAVNIYLISKAKYRYQRYPCKRWSKDTDALWHL